MKKITLILILIFNSVLYAGQFTKVVDLNTQGDCYPFNITRINNDSVAFYCYSKGNGGELWISDGTAEGTSLLKNTNPNGNQTIPVTVLNLDNGKIVFHQEALEDQEMYQELWITDGTKDGTQRLYRGLGGIEPFNFKNTIYFLFNDYKNQGIEEGIYKVLDGGQTELIVPNVNTIRAITENKVIVSYYYSYYQVYSLDSGSLINMPEPPQGLRGAYSHIDDILIFRTAEGGLASFDLSNFTSKTILTNRDIGLELDKHELTLSPSTLIDGQVYFYILQGKYTYSDGSSFPATTIFLKTDGQTTDKISSLGPTPSHKYYAGSYGMPLVAKLNDKIYYPTPNSNNKEEMWVYDIKENAADFLLKLKADDIEGPRGLIAANNKIYFVSQYIDSLEGIHSFNPSNGELTNLDSTLDPESKLIPTTSGIFIAAKGEDQDSELYFMSYSGSDTGTVNPPTSEPNSSGGGGSIPFLTILVLVILGIRRLR